MTKRDVLHTADSKPLDTRLEIITPENIRYPVYLAGPFVRAAAFLVDMVFIHSVFLAVILVIGVVCAGLSFFPESELFRNILFGLTLLFYMFLFWFGGAIQEGCFGGKTIGKMATGLRVLSVEGQPITKYQAILRNIVRSADLLLGPFLVLFMAGNPRFMRFGDVAAGTIVVRDEDFGRGSDLLTFRHPEVVRMISSIPPDFRLQPSLEKFLSLYIHRRTDLSPFRRWEITRVLVQRLSDKARMPRNLNPDLFLCALYQWAYQEKFRQTNE